MKTAKTIEELYKEAKEFDVVITVDAALATALNARVDEPRLNGFAYTAKEVAAMREVSPWDAPSCPTLTSSMRS